MAIMVNTTSAFKRSKANNGQVLVELALAIPFLLMVLFCLFYFGRQFYIKQILLIACQATAQLASQYPNLNSPGLRNYLRGFTTSGQVVNLNSPNYEAFSAANMLSNGNSGNLPPGSQVYIMPYDTTNINGIQASPNSVSVVIQYPLNIFVNTQNLNIWMGNGNPLTLSNFTVTEYSSYPMQLNQ